MRREQPAVRRDWLMGWPWSRQKSIRNDYGRRSLRDHAGSFSMLVTVIIVAGFTAILDRLDGALDFLLQVLAIRLAERIVNCVNNAVGSNDDGGWNAAHAIRLCDFIGVVHGNGKG